MGLRVTFELDDDDLRHFRLIMRQARATAARIAPEDIVATAEELITSIGPQGAPAFVVERLQKLRLLIDMLSDIDWRLPQSEANRVLSALAYFTEPEDLIPDTIPGLGFLDDAIMVELAFREMKHEIEAYDDFVAFRTKYDKGFRFRKDPEVRKQKLLARRDQLRERAERRRERDLENEHIAPAGIL